MLTTRELQDEIIHMKKEKDICILAHAYQSHDIWEVADYVGDSYGLSVQAAKAAQSTVLMCGVRFMADGRADGCGTDFRGEKDVSGLYRGSVY